MCRRALLPAVVSLLLAACSDASAPPTAPAVAPVAARGIANAPGELPNLIRYWDDRYGFFILDEEAGLILVEGAPLDPRTYWMCPGGTAGTSGKTYQEVGIRQGVVRSLVVGMDVALHVYRASDFVGGNPLSFICGADPIAIGSGEVRVTDNDLYWTSNHRNAVGIMMHGTVTWLATGETMRASGTYRHVYDPRTASIDVVTSTVRLR